MKTNTLLIGAVAFAAGYYASKMMAPQPAAAVGASWRCQQNPNAAGCDPVRKIHTLILPMQARTAYSSGRNMVAGL